MTTLAQDLGGVVRLLEKATDGRWYVEPMGKNEFEQLAYSVNMDDGRIPTVESGEFYGDPHDANAACAAVNFLRAHSAEIAGALAGWQPIETAPKTGIAVLLWQPWKSGRDCTTIGHYANGWCDRFNEEMTPEPTHWRPLPAPPTLDSAMQQGGGGGE